MKNYRYTALSLLVCATATGCYSGREKAIPGGETEDAGESTRSNSPSTTTEPDLTDAGPTGSITERPTTKPQKGNSGPDASEPDEPDPKPTEPDASDAMGEPNDEEDSFFHPTPAGEETRAANGGTSTAANSGGPGPAPTASSDLTGAPPGGSAGDQTDDSPGDGELDDGDEPTGEELIEEADILRRDGDTVYALSYGSGLAVIDISSPSDLEVLGRTTFEHTPSEMYLDGSEVVVLFQGNGGYYYDYVDDSYSSAQSTIGVFDVSDPRNIVEVDSATVEGAILDSRKIGNRLYVAANDSCSWCEGAGATVGSFDLAGSGIAPITTLAIPATGGNSYTPTIYVNNERLYLAQQNYGYVDAEGNPVSEEEVWGSDSTSGSVSWAGETWAVTMDNPIGATGSTATQVVDAGVGVEVDGGEVTTGEPGSTGSTSEGYTYTNWTVLRVVDISDASGALSLGASIKITGAVNSRWQMDEYDGVLRVVSQNAWTGEAPAVETFTIADSETYTKAGHLDIELPRPETLQSVRFDGDRGYVVTFEQVDPLFTLDLSDPTTPVQLGELEIPGFLYHMIPRGDRLYAVGYDNSNEDSLHASVFDVSDLGNPVMLERVNFGGSWGWLGEDQDDIEKSVQMLDDLGLMLIPYTGYDYTEDACGREQSGIQLIDFTANGLTLRGSTEAPGYARRAFYHRDHLFGYSDNAIQSFDISDRDNPVAVDALTFAYSVEKVIVRGDQLVRLGHDGFDHAFLDVVPVETPNAPIQASALTFEQWSSCDYVSYYKPAVRDGIVYLPRQVFNYADYTSSVNVLALDVRNPSAPVKLTEAALAASSDVDDVRVLQTDAAIVVAQRSSSYNWTPGKTHGTSTTGAVTIDFTTASAVTMDAIASTAAPIEDATDDTTNDGTGTFATMGVETKADYDSGFADDYYPGYYALTHKLRLNVFDVRDVAGGLTVKTVDVAEEWLNNGFASSLENIQIADQNGYQQSLVAGGDVIVSQHRVYEPDGSGYRYFAERLDVSNPAEPTWLEAVNIPGQAVALASDDVHLVTLDNVTVPVQDADCTQSDDYVVCYNRVLELSGLTLHAKRAVRDGKVRLGSNRNYYRAAIDGSAVYVQEDNYTSGALDTLAYSYRLQPLGRLDADAHVGYLSDWFGVPVLLNYDQEISTAILLSTQSGVIDEAARVHDVRCNPAVVGETAVYCPAGFDGVAVAPLE